MEYHVVYSGNRCAGNGNAPQKRKRFEKNAQQIDGVLALHKTVSGASTSTMMVTLYHMKQSGISGSDSESSNENDEDDDIESDPNIKPKKWKDRQKYSTRKKSKPTNARRRNNSCNHAHPAIKTVVYSGNITRLIKNGSAICNVNDAKSKSSILPSTDFSTDDILIVGPYEVHIVGKVSRIHCHDTSDRDIGSMKENDAETAVDTPHVKNITHQPSTIAESKYNNFPSFKTKARTIVSVPLQSRRNNGQKGVVIRTIEVKPPQQHSTKITSKAANTTIPNVQQTEKKYTISKATVPVNCPKIRPSSILSSSLPTIPQKSLPIPTKPMPPATKPTLYSLTSSATNVLPHIPLPASICTVLRAHQIDGVDFIWRTLREKKGCILGDEMGLGKTLMTIACIAAIHRTHREKQFVVVCPSTLVVNWSNEFDKWLGPASQPKRVSIQEGGADGLQQIRAYMQKSNQQIKHQPGQVLIISYEFFRRHVSIFDCKGYTSIGLLVVDEGHRLKNAGDSRTFAALSSLPTDARLCITATPIQNNLCEFYNLADFCCPGILGPSISHFRKHYERIIAATNQKNATRQELIAGSMKSKELDIITKTFMIRRLQKDVLQTMLPPRTEALLFCRPTKIQCELYGSACSNISLGKISDALTTLTALRKICAHPLIYGSMEETAKQRDPRTSEISSSGKMIVLHNLLQEIRRDACDDKVVIVSNFTSVLSLVERLILQPCSYSYLRLDGKTKDRQALVDTFNRTSVNRTFCLLLSSKAGGCGLNIVGANRLIMFDADWNPATCQQAMGRIYRQGQTKPCMIYRLVTSGTVEEVILQRQILKRGLSKLTVDLSNGYAEKFSKEELADCFDLKEDSICDTKVKLGANWPSYDPARLSSLGCNDEPLLKVATAIPKSLCFVHISRDHESSHREDLDENICNPCSQVGYESEEEENEFML